MCSSPINDPVENAVSLFDQGFSCAQAVFSAFAPRFGLSAEMALKIATPFGGGVGRLAGTCGAVSGALMALGLRYGNTDAEDKEAKEANYALARAFIEQFKERHGTIVCRELLKYDISVPEELQKSRELQIFHTLCPKFVRDAAEIVLLLEEENLA